LYTDNWRRSVLEIQKDPATGGYWHVDIDDGFRKHPFVWIRRDIGPLVKKLVEEVQPGARLLAASQVINYPEFMAIWTQTLGKQLAGEEGLRRDRSRSLGIGSLATTI